MIERWYGTLKDRTKPMRGLEIPETAILKGWPIHYNFLRPHESLGGRTPAEASGINLPFEDGWGDMIHWATVFNTKSQFDGDGLEIELMPT